MNAHVFAYLRINKFKTKNEQIFSSQEKLSYHELVLKIPRKEAFKCWTTKRSLEYIRTLLLMQKY